MGFLDELLTGEGPKLETRSLSTIDPAQRESLNALLARLQQPGRDPSSFVSPLTEPERTSLTALEERSKALAMPSSTLDNASSSLNKQLDFEGQTADASNFFTNAVQNPLLDAFQRDILPQISRSFGGADFFSTERQQAEGTARRDLLNTLGAEKSRVELDQFNKSRERALTAAGLVPGIEQAEAGRTQQQLAILEALGLPREIAQAGLDKSNTENARIQELLAQLSLTPTMENIGMTNPGSAGILNILLGGAAGGLGGSLGELLGGKLDDWLGSLLGGASGTGNPSGQTPADTTTPGSNTGTTVTDILTGAGAGAAGGAAAGAIGNTPGGTVTVTEGNQPVSTTPQVPSGINAGPLAGGLAGGIAAGSVIPSLLTPAGTSFITEGAAGALASQLGGGAAATGAAGSVAGGATTGGVTAGTGAAAGGAGGSAGGAGAAAGGTAGGIAAGLGVAALPALIMALGGLANDRTQRNQLAITESGMQQVTLQSGQRVLKLPDGTFVPNTEHMLDEIRSRWGVIPTDQFYSWLDTLPKIEGNIRTIIGRPTDTPKGGTPRAKD